MTSDGRVDGMKQTEEEAKSPATPKISGFSTSVHNKPETKLPPGQYNTVRLKKIGGRPPFTICNTIRIILTPHKDKLALLVSS